MKEPSSELQLILVWHNALDRAERILADAQEVFAVRDVLRVHWSPEKFSRNLTKFYDDDLPPGSDKERHCGVGDFLLIIVEDGSPVYARRPVTSGAVRRVSTKMSAAKARYREWTGGGHRVHTSLDKAEFARDSFLLLGRRAERYVPGGSPRWDGTIPELHVDLVGTDGWDDLAQLARGLDLTGPFVSLEPPDGGELTLLVEDFWSATVMATGSKPTGTRSGRHVLSVGGRPFVLELLAVGGGHLDPDWEADMLTRRVHGSEVVPVLSSEDQLNYTLYRELFIEPGSSKAPIDRADARQALESFLARMGYGHARVAPARRPRSSPLVGAVRAVTERALRAGTRIFS